MQFSTAKDLINWIEKEKRFTNTTSIERMKFYANLFGNPEKKFKSIHVTGTNGKGSTVAFLRNIYETKGLKVATFTSPYVTNFNERIYYNKKNISDDDLLKYGNLILAKYPLIEQSGYELPVFFDFITLLAFLYFADQKDLDLAVIEVGIGGRLDATNIIIPIASVITNVSYDHMKQLGNSLELILKEKLGIVKEGVPLITSIKDQSLIELCKKECEQKHSKLIVCDFSKLIIKKADLEKSIFIYQGNSEVEISLIGLHQIENACLVMEVVKECNNITKSFKRSFEVSNEILYEGLKKTKWPGRLEKVADDPLIYLDGGHNIGCLERICQFVSKLNYKYKRAIVAISMDKNIEEMVNLLDNTFDEIIFTHYSLARSAKSTNLFELSKCKNKFIIDDVKDCIAYVNNNKVEFSLFIGSLYLISEVRPYFLKN